MEMQRGIVCTGITLGMNGLGGSTIGNVWKCVQQLMYGNGINRDCMEIATTVTVWKY